MADDTIPAEAPSEVDIATRLQNAATVQHHLDNRPARKTTADLTKEQIMEKAREQEYSKKHSQVARVKYLSEKWGRAVFRATFAPVAQRREGCVEVLVFRFRRRREKN